MVTESGAVTALFVVDSWGGLMHGANSHCIAHCIIQGTGGRSQTLEFGAPSIPRGTGGQQQRETLVRK